MWTRIEITCFAASYLVVFALELSRIAFKSGTRQVALVGFAAAGMFAHTLFLAHQIVRNRMPLSSSFDWYLIAAWVLMAAYLYLIYFHPRQAIGVFFLPLVLALIAVAALWADRHPFPQDRATHAWATIHGVFLLFGTVAIFFGFIAGVMYLVQSFRLKAKLPPSETFRLPSLEWLQRVNERAIVVSMLLLACGFFAGIVLNLVNHQQQAVDRVPWNDPVVWSSALMLLWLAAAAVFNAAYKPARVGRKVAYLTVASFAFLLFVLGAKLFLDTEHSSNRGAQALRKVVPKQADGAGRAISVAHPPSRLQWEWVEIRSRETL